MESIFKKKPQRRWFHVNIAEFLGTPILKNICKRRLLEMAHSMKIVQSADKMYRQNCSIQFFKWLLLTVKNYSSAFKAKLFFCKFSEELYWWMTTFEISHIIFLVSLSTVSKWVFYVPLMSYICYLLIMNKIYKYCLSLTPCMIKIGTCEKIIRSLSSLSLIYSF